MQNTSRKNVLHDEASMDSLKNGALLISACVQVNTLHTAYICVSNTAPRMETRHVDLSAHFIEHCVRTKSQLQGLRCT